MLHWKQIEIKGILIVPITKTMSGKKKSSLAQGNIAWNDVVKRLKDIAKGKFSGTLLERVHKLVIIRYRAQKCAVRIFALSIEGHSQSRRYP